MVTHRDRTPEALMIALSLMVALTALLNLAVH